MVPAFVFSPRMNKADQAKQAEQRQKARYLQAVAKVGTLTAGCRAARCSPHTVYKWREHDLEFSVSEHQTREAFADQIEEYVVKMAKANNVTAAIFLLKALRPDKYRERLDLRHTMTEPAVKAYADVDLERV